MAVWMVMVVLVAVMVVVVMVILTLSAHFCFSFKCCHEVILIVVVMMVMMQDLEVVSCEGSQVVGCDEINMRITMAGSVVVASETKNCSCGNG